MSSLPEDERSEEPGIIVPVPANVVDTTAEQDTTIEVRTTHMKTEESVDIRVEHKGMY